MSKRKMTKEELKVWFDNQKKTARLQSKDGTIGRLTKRINVQAGGKITTVRAVVVSEGPTSKKVGARVMFNVMFLNEESLEIPRREESGMNANGKVTYSYNDRYTMEPFARSMISITRESCPKGCKSGDTITISGITHITYNGRESFDVGSVSLCDDPPDLFTISSRAFQFPYSHDIVKNQVILPFINENDATGLIENDATFTMYMPRTIKRDVFEFKTLQGDVEPSVVGVQMVATYMDNDPIESVLVNMPLYGNQVKPLGISDLTTWKELAPTIMECWKGVVHGYIDWDKTNSIPLNIGGATDSTYTRAMEIRGMITWDIPYMLSRAGLKVGPDTANKLLDNSPKHDASDNHLASNPSGGIFNLNEFNGFIKQFFIQPDEYEFFVVANLSRSDIELIRSKNPTDDDIYALLQDEDSKQFNVRFNGDICYVVFVQKK